MATITYKCPNCDGGLLFDPSTQKYHCEYCQSSFSQEELDALAPAAASDTAVPTGMEAEGALGGGAGAGSAGRRCRAGGAMAGVPWPEERWLGVLGPEERWPGALGPEEDGRERWGWRSDGRERWSRRRRPGAADAFSGGAAREPGADSDGYAQDAAYQGDAMLYTCPSCGAEIVTDATTAATFCYYCHNPVVLSGRLTGTYQPDFAIPFQIDRKRAQEVFSQWIAKKKFVPREFYSPKQIETMTGVYFPYWLFSCKVDGSVQGQGTKLRVWTAGNLRYTETKIYDIARQGTVEVNNVARNALKKANRRLVDGVQPFEMGEMQRFSMGYLSGFMAENRDMERNTFETEVSQEVRDFAVSGLKSQGTAYDRVQITNQRAEISEGFWQYALLPVWTLTYKERQGGKIYYFAMNGQTGKVCGELPVDKGKLMILFASIFLPLLIILLILGYII